MEGTPLILVVDVEDETLTVEAPHGWNQQAGQRMEPRQLAQRQSGLALAATVGCSL